MKHLDIKADDWPDLSALLDELLTLPQPQRAGWVDALTDERARFQERLRRLLKVCGDVERDHFLEQLPSLPLFESTSPRDAASEGLIVGSYRLISELGRGGMGTVWLAERADGHLKRQVALKLPRVTWDGALAERLMRERDILASLTHPHIARLYDAGTDDHGRPYLAMEYVQGSGIDDYCAAHGAGVGQRLNLLLQVCEAVAHAHAQLVVHRDLKPGNILVTTGGQVRLLDFGIAKLMQGDRTQESALTRVSGRALSLDYASPEQIRGDAIGTASDVYSLGVVAYKLLAGQPPYRLKRGSAAEWEEAIVHAEPARASDMAASRELKKRLRGDLDAILNKALKKSPADRYPTMMALAEDIRRHLDGRPVVARPESRSYLVRRFIGRHRVAVTAVAAVILALSMGLAIALWQTRLARLSEQSAARALVREGAVKMLTMDTLSLVASSSVRERQTTTSAAKTMRAKLDEYEQRYKDQPEQRLGLLEAVGSQLLYFGDYEGSLDVTRRYLALLQETHSEGWRVLRAYLGISRALDNLQRFPEAAAVLEEGLNTVPDTPDALDSRVAVLGSLSRILKLLDRRQEAQRWLMTAVLRASDTKDGTVRWVAHSALAAFYFGYDDPKALQLMRAAHEAYLADTHARPVEMAQSHLFLGRALLNVGRLSEAERAFAEARRRSVEIFGSVDRDSVIALGRWATALASQGRYVEANQLLAQQRVDIAAHPGPDTAIAMATTVALQLDAALLEGDLKAAVGFAAVDSAATLPRDTAIQQVADARLMVVTGRPGEAVRRLEENLNARPPGRRWGIDSFSLGIALAEARLALGEPGVALAGLGELMAAMQAQQALRNANYRQARLLSALALSRNGQSADALSRLTAFDQESVGLLPSSLANQADTAAIRVELMHVAGRQADALSALAAMKVALVGQHVESPRWQDFRRLSELLSR